METPPDPRLEALEQALDDWGVADEAIREIARARHGAVLAEEGSGMSREPNGAPGAAEGV